MVDVDRQHIQKLDLIQGHQVFTKQKSTTQALNVMQVLPMHFQVCESGHGSGETFPATIGSLFMDTVKFNVNVRLSQDVYNRERTFWMGLESNFSDYLPIFEDYAISISFTDQDGSFRGFPDIVKVIDFCGDLDLMV